MSKTTKSFKEVEKSLKKLAKNAKTELPKDLKESWNHAISGVDASAISAAGSNLVSNVTGNSKAAKRTRSSVEDAVIRAQKALSTEKKSSGGRKFLVFLLITGVAIAAAVAANKKTATS